MPSAAATAETFLRLGRKDEAERWFREALSADPDGFAAVCGLIRLSLDKKALAEAVNLLRANLSRAPFDMRLMAEQKSVGLALYAENLWEDAEPWLKSALEIEPWDVRLRAAYTRAKRPDYVDAEVRDKATGRVLRRYAAREGKAYIYVIDVAGTCNLRCPTCPVGNSALAGRPRGLMHYDLFERIVEKIIKEKPCERPIVNLYNWGEPLLNPDLPAMIKLLRRHDLRASLSSNLNIKRGLEAVIAANPDEFKISLSGFTAETYERAHVGGDLARVKENMRLIRVFADRHKATTRFWVGHHIYRSNQAQMPEVRQFCEELGFDYRPMMAFYMPLERLIDHLNGKPNPRDQGIVADLLRKPEEIPRAAAARRSGAFDCELRFNQTVINHDGSVALCCTVYDRENMLGANFLDADFAELEERKYDHPFCQTCFHHKLEYAPGELDPRENAHAGGFGNAP